MATLGQEWAAVAAFYSCYLLVRASLQSDPLFEDEGQIRRLDKDLQRGDKDVEVHQWGTRAGNGFGVNELVTLVYPHAQACYHLLHTMSVDVRYKKGLPSGIPLDRIMGAAKALRDEFKAGHLRHEYSVSADLISTLPAKK